MSERRTAIRKVTNEELSPIAQDLRELATDISETGVFIRTAELLPVGTPVSVRFSIIADDFETIKADGTVVRVVEAGASRAPGLGVRFTALDATSRALLQRYCAAS